MSADLTAILKAIEQILELEKKIETSIAAEKDAGRRARLFKACQERDINAIREILFSVE